MALCARPAKGSHKDDSVLPCGTMLHYGSDKTTRRTTTLLCPKCKAEAAAEELATCPT